METWWKHWGETLETQWLLKNTQDLGEKKWWEEILVELYKDHPVQLVIIQVENMRPNKVNWPPQIHTTVRIGHQLLGLLIPIPERQMLEKISKKEKKWETDFSWWIHKLTSDFYTKCPLLILDYIAG